MVDAGPAEDAVGDAGIVENMLVNTMSYVVGPEAQVDLKNNSLLMKSSASRKI